jgi:hypothetical protein
MVEGRDQGIPLCGNEETDDHLPSSSLGGINDGSDPSRTGEIIESGTHGTLDLAPSMSGCGTRHHPRRRRLSGPDRFPLCEPTFTGNSRSSPADLLSSQGDALNWVASLGDVEEAIYPPHLSQISNFQSVRLYYEIQDSNSNNSHLSNSILSSESTDSVISSNHIPLSSVNTVESTSREISNEDSFNYDYLLDDPDNSDEYLDYHCEVISAPHDASCIEHSDGSLDYICVHC